MNSRLKIMSPSLRETTILLVAWLGVFFTTVLALKATVVSTGEMAIWPADAITLAMMLALKQRPVLALLVCRSASEVSAAAVGLAFAPSLLVNLSSTVAILFVYLVMNRRKNPYHLYAFKDLILLFFLAFVQSCISAPLQAMCLVLYYKVSVPKVIESCFAANLIGVALIVPTIMLMLDRGGISSRISARLGIRIPAFAAVALLVGVVFYLPELPLLFLVPMAMVAVAYTTDVSVVAMSVLATAGIAAVATVSGYGPFAAMHYSHSIQLLVLQVFLGILTLFALPSAALISEHRKLKDSLVAAKLDAEAASEAKSQFLAMMSHEIRTPLNGVLGMAQIMAMNDLHPDQAERLKVVRRSGEVLLSILNDVLDIAKIEAGKLEIEKIEFDLGEVLRSTSHCYRPLALEKGLSYVQDIEAVEGVYCGDPTRLRQILANLLSNALKFTENGEIRISAHYAGDVLSLSVADTGIGIPAAQVDKLFAKFMQADETTTRRFGGTGLGLSICRDLAVLMGGEIRVESEPGSGSSFTASIPMIRLGDTELPEELPGAIEDSIGRGIRVLAAEDNATNQLVLRTFLQMADFEVVIVGNGEEAVATWSDHDFDVILMDVQMPVMDGPEAAREIRARELATGRLRTPIIALTANTMAHQVDGYVANGMDGHIAKPIDAETLFRSILSAVEQRMAAKSEAA